MLYLLCKYIVVDVWNWTIQFVKLEKDFFLLCCVLLQDTGTNFKRINSEFKVVFVYVLLLISDLYQMSCVTKDRKKGGSLSRELYQFAKTKTQNPIFIYEFQFNYSVSYLQSDWQNKKKYEIKH